MKEFLAYAEFERFWERFRPDTPYGRDVKERQHFMADRRELEATWDKTDIALGLLASLDSDDVARSRISHHLKRLPRFPAEARPVYGEVEIFQVKKFLHNYHALVELLPAQVRKAFGFGWASEVLLQTLGRGRQTSESFYIADAYSADLAAVREEIRRADDRIACARAARISEIEARWGFGFEGREFLLVPRDSLADAAKAAELLVVEPYDDLNCVVRPLRSGDELVARERRAGLLLKERSLEEDVLEQLSHAIREELGKLSEYREAVLAFDLAFARARLAREYRLVRPTLFDRPGAVEIEGGRFVPCEEWCREMGTRYEPLDATLDTGVMVIFGSNMGGKTVVLKTLAFLQACAQSGLFVPARRFRTCVFEHFHYVGELAADGERREGGRGLSGFGFEIEQLKRAWSDFDRPALALFDEFARTTNSVEAEALISAVIEAVARIPHVLAVFSTHFRGVRRVPGTRVMRMKGLDRRHLDFQEAAGAVLQERIRLIDRHMVYHLVPDVDGGEGPSSADALAVAALLGVDASVVERAESFFSQARPGRATSDAGAGSGSGRDRPGDVLSTGIGGQASDD